MPTNRAAQRRRPQAKPARGLSIVELMVGIAIGLFVLAGATVMATAQLSDNRRMLLEMQVHQDLRVAGDLITRSVRRAGFFGHSALSVWPASSAPALFNPYAAIDAPGSSITFHASQDSLGGSPTDDNEILDSDEYFGFRLNASNKTIDALVGQGNWQALTDANVIEVTDFEVNLISTDLDAPCGATCPVLGPGGCPLKLRKRDVAIDIKARAVHDHDIQRSLSSRVRLRNDLPVEVC